MTEYTCDLCHCKVFEEEERYRVFANEEWFLTCALCGSAAEKLGHYVVIN